MIKLSARKTKSIQEKIAGLIGKNEPENLLITTRFGIHTFGLKFPIDVLILDNTNKVVSIKQRLKPCRIFLWNPVYEKVIELPSGTVKEKSIELHDTIDLTLV